jgi:hypothetical protein
MVASPELGNGDSRDLKQAVGGASLPAHTPGPWRAEQESVGPKRAFAIWAGRRAVAHYLAFDDFIRFASEKAEPEHVEANARLIAAAPDLLEVTQIAGAFIGGMATAIRARGPQDARDEGILALDASIRTAIAKALGQAAPSTTEPQPQILGGDQ